jgi:hypothetical protein
MSDKISVLQSAYIELQEQFNELRKLNSQSFNKLNNSHLSKDQELFYEVQLQDSNDLIKAFERQYLFMLEYISLELGDLVGELPEQPQENAIERAESYFLEWLVQMAIEE